jgi:hypothetical protein
MPNIQVQSIVLVTALLLMPACVAAPPENEDLAAHSDDFNDPKTLTNWLRVYREERMGADQLERFDIGRTKTGWMTLMPHTSVWYQDWRGVLVHKRVRGDFVVTTHVRATGRSGDRPPASQFSLAGIMVRTPRNVTPQTWRPGGENYMFLSLGAADTPGSYQFEVKTTVNSDSQKEVEAANGPESLIRVARIGAHFILLRKPVTGGDWVVHRRYHRPDMPEELQVGMTAYTDWPTAERIAPEHHNRNVIRNGNPDLLASFEYFNFRRPDVPAAIRSRAFSDVNQVADSDVLRLVGGP